MTQKSIIDYVKGHPSGKVKIAYVDIDGILRGKYISVEKFLSAVEGGTAFCNVIFGWDADDYAYDNVKFTGWHTGYPDSPARLDFDTFRKIPWENDVPFFLGEFVTEEGKPSPVCPRQLLKSVVSNSLKAGFAPSFAQEFEWFNFVESPGAVREKKYKDLQSLTPGMFGYSILRMSMENRYLSELFDGMKKFGVPLDGLHTETGPGVLEAAITHADAVEAGNRATLFKTAVKEIAYKLGIMATFMAKFSENLPGCGGHVHQSLWDKTGKTNLFHDPKDKNMMSETMKQYLAGQLFCLPHILPMYAPTINSYKRLVEGAWAPTTLTWGIDNRTVAIRVLNNSMKSCRIETRVIGADVNPYLAIAAALASGLYGVRKKLKLQPATTGNGYIDSAYGILPRTLDAATQLMKKSVVAREILGAPFVEHFVQTREWEWRQHLKPVTDWERERYFEII